MDGHFLVTYDVRPSHGAICKDLVLRISSSPQRKKFLDNRTKDVYSSGVLRGKERKCMYGAEHMRWPLSPMPVSLPPCTRCRSPVKMMPHTPS